MIKKRGLWLFIAALACFCALVLAIVPTFVNAEEPVEYHKADIFTTNVGVKEYAHGTEFFEQFHVKNASLTENVLKVPKSNSGIGVFCDGKNMEFSYKNAISFADKSLDDCLIEIYPLFGDNYVELESLKITLTDTENAGNAITIHFDSGYDKGFIYSRVLYKGLDAGWLGTQNPPLRVGSRGASFNNLTYNGIRGGSAYPAAFAKGQISPFTMFVDYESRIIAAANYSDSSCEVKTVLDLDYPVHVGSGNEWQGFKRDTAYLSVNATFKEMATEQRKAGIIVKSIDGDNLEGDFSGAEDLPKATITPDTFKEYNYSLPYGAVGVEYNVPSVSAQDWYFGIADESYISYVIEKENGGDYQATDYTGINGGKHIFDSAGKYRINYQVDNGLVVSNSIIDFEIRNELNPILVALSEEYGAPKLGQYLYVPETVVSGGSGNLTKKETLYFNGQEVSLDESRSLYISQGGTISLRVDVEGYTGAAYTKYFPVEVEHGTIIRVENFPKLIRGNNSERLVLPKAYAYNTQTMSEVPASITVDGAPIGEDRAITTEKTSGSLQVQYSAGGVTKEYTIAVIEGDSTKQKPSSFVLKKGNVELKDGAGGLSLTASQSGAGITWGYPAVSGYASENLQIALTQASENTSFQYIDVILSDANENAKDFYFRVYNGKYFDGSLNKTTINVNGSGSSFELDGSISSVGSSLSFYIANNALYNAKDKMLYDFSDVYNARLSFVTFVFGGVSGNSSIRVDAISNQLLSYNSKYGWIDSSAVLSFSRKLNSSTAVTLEDSFSIPTCEAFDLTSYVSSVKVTVKAPDNVTRIFNNQATNEALSFTASAKGNYKLEYLVTDGNGMQRTNSYSVVAYDKVNPVITINGVLPPSFTVNQTVKLPSATAVDGVDGECAVKILIRYHADYSYATVDAEGKYSFNKVGKYDIIYQAMDTSGNCTQYICTVDVTEA